MIDFLAILKYIDPRFEAEYRPVPWRKWRIDYSIPELKIGVEKNGNAWGVRGGGRHGNPADLQKLNCLQAIGWRIYQYGTSKEEAVRMVQEMRFYLGRGSMPFEDVFPVLGKKKRSS